MRNALSGKGPCSPVPGPVEHRRDLFANHQRPVVAIASGSATRAIDRCRSANLRNDFSYGVKLWPALLRFLADGRREIDSHIAERAIRSIAVGRRN